MALRKNGITLATALSEGGGRNPVSQALLTFLRPGDVVQLEIVQGRIEEPQEAGQAGAFNSFSGWLIGPTFEDLNEADFKDDIPSFEAAAQKCQEDIIIGGQYLLRNFYDIAMEIAEETGISKKYTLTYENALKELQQHMPEFVGNVEEFLAAAMPESNKKK